TSTSGSGGTQTSSSSSSSTTTSTSSGTTGALPTGTIKSAVFKVTYNPLLNSVKIELVSF
ncbi:MAG TPA: hypothetical protein VKB86_14660, partial [Pyrinomonadaceae bacterium]|nr:hypothetical protein [Pyrinomonadaceae bacterium]